MVGRTAGGARGHSSSALQERPLNAELRGVLDVARAVLGSDGDHGRRTGFPLTGAWRTRIISELRRAS
jgi:hypothetical protein